MSGCDEQTVISKPYSSIDDDAIEMQIRTLQHRSSDIAVSRLVLILIIGKQF